MSTLSTFVNNFVNNINLCQHFCQQYQPLSTFLSTLSTFLSTLSTFLSTLSTFVNTINIINLCQHCQHYQPLSTLSTFVITVNLCHHCQPLSSLSTFVNIFICIFLSIIFVNNFYQYFVSALFINCSSSTWYVLEHIFTDVFEISTTMEQCPICLEEIKQLRVTQCNHKFCKPCIEEWIKHHDTCPQCRRQFRSRFRCQQRYREPADPVSQLMNRTFPIGSWSISSYSATVETLSQYLVAISLGRQTNWVPSSWVEYYQRTNRMNLVNFLNSGVRGMLFIDGIEAPQHLYLCPRCKYVTSEQFVLRFMRH